MLIVQFTGSMIKGIFWVDIVFFGDNAHWTQKWNHNPVFFCCTINPCVPCPLPIGSPRLSLGKFRLWFKMHMRCWTLILPVGPERALLHEPHFSRKNVKCAESSIFSRGRLAPSYKVCAMCGMVHGAQACLAWPHILFVAWQMTCLGRECVFLLQKLVEHKNGTTTVIFDVVINAFVSCALHPGPCQLT